MSEDSTVADAASLDSDSDHSNSSLPDFAQIVATQERQPSQYSTPQPPTTSKILTVRERPRQLAETMEGGKSLTPKEEIVEQALPLTPVTAPSPRKTRSSTRKAPSQDGSPPTVTFSEGMKTGMSSATSGMSSSSSTPKSTHREKKRRAHELTDGVSQFSPSLTQYASRSMSPSFSFSLSQTDQTCSPLSISASARHPATSPPCPSHSVPAYPSPRTTSLSFRAGW